MAIRSEAGDLLYRRANLPASTAFTASMWVWMVDPVGFQDSWFGMSDATSSPGNWLWMLGDGNEDFAINHSGSLNSPFATQIATGEWSFVAIRQLSGEFKGYHWDEDGTLQTTTITVSPGWTNAQFSVASDAFGNATDLRVAAIKLWDAGLSDAEIEAERLQIQPRRFEDLNAFWPCFPGSAERLRDYSGKGRDLGEDGTFTDEQGPPIGWGGVPIIVGQVAATDQTIAVNQAVETDTAQAVTPARVLAVDQATETDTAGIVTPARSVLVGQITETQLAQVVTAVRAIVAGQAIETDTAQVITPARAATSGQAVETDTAQAVTPAKAVAVAQAVETDTGRIISAQRRHAVGQAVENNTAQSITIAKGAAVGQAVETDTAFAIAVAGSITIGQAIETDTAQAITPARVVDVDQAVETDTAGVVAPAKADEVEQVLETNTAGVVAPVKSVTAGQAVETDTAQAITPALQGQVIVNQAIEVDTALVVAPAKAVTVGQADETETAQPIQPVRVRPVITATETDTAQLVTAARSLVVGQAVTSEIAQPVTAARVVVVAQATETDTAGVIDAVKLGIVVGSAVETDTAQPISIELRRLVDTAVETDTAGDVAPRKTRVVNAVLIGYAPSYLRHWQDEDGRTGRARYHQPVGMPPEVIQALDHWDNGRPSQVLRVLDPITDGMSVNLGTIVDGAEIPAATFSAAQVARNATFAFTANIGTASDGLLLQLGTDIAGGVSLGTIASPTRLAVAIGDSVAAVGDHFPIRTPETGLIVLAISMDEGRLKVWQNGVELIDLLFAEVAWQDEAAAGGFHRAGVDFANLAAPNAIGAGAADDVTLSGNLMYYDQQLPVSF